MGFYISLTQLFDKQKEPLEIVLKNACYRLEAYTLITDN